MAGVIIFIVKVYKGLLSHRIVVGVDRTAFHKEIDYMALSHKIQWHQGFYSGLKLELREYNDILEYETEHELSQKPLRIDMLVIKMKASREISNPIASFFKKHNIIEYKSPDDELSIDDFYKVIGYAGIYKSLGKKVNEIPAEDITISIFRHSYPEKLISNLKKTGAEITAENPGVYRVLGLFYIPIRIIVSSRLSEDHVALKILAKNIEKDSVERFLKNLIKLDNKDDKENIEAVLEVSTSANTDMFNELKEASDMGAALRELMKDEINEGIALGRKEGREEGIKGIIAVCKSFGGSSLDAVEKIVATMGYSQSEADSLVSKYWYSYNMSFKAMVA